VPYEPFSYAGFGKGLNLRDKVDAVSEEEAIDCLNVEFTERGTVKQRTGYAVFNAVELDGQGDTLWPHYESDGTKHLIVGDTATGQLTALLAADGTEVDIEASFSNGGCFGFQRFGAPGTEYTYCGNGVDELWYYDGTSFTNVPDDGGRIPPKGGALATTPTSNRLACSRFTTTTGGPNGAATNPSTVWFSNAGNPVVWGDNDFVSLDPGDGEAIQAMINWREFLFVFKETKFWVFTGESTAATGSPVFERYPVNTGHGAVGPRAVTADETGVYFASRHGVFRTVGGEPVKVSDPVEPIFSGDSSDFFSGGVLSHSVASLIAVNAFDGRIHVNYSTGGTANDRTLVYDTTYEWWSLWDTAAADMVGWRAGTQEQLFFTAPTGTNNVSRFGAYTNDAGAAITAFWRSGWANFGLVIEKTIRETKLWGTGQITLGVSVDFAGSGFYADDPVEPVLFSETTAFWQTGFWQTGNWGADLRVSDELVRHAVRGTKFSVLFFNNTLNKTFSIHRLDQHLRESLIPSKS
jgi:hypothetical protein